MVICGQMPKVVLFDFDGTLFDNLKQRYDAFCTVFNHCNCSPPSVEDFSLNCKPPFYSYYRERGINLTDEEIGGLYYPVENASQARLFDDVVPVVKEFIQRGFRLGIVSARPHKQLFSLCRSQRITSFFHYVVGSCSEKHEAIIYYKHLCKTNDNIWFIGDNAKDIEDGVVAGAKTAHIRRGLTFKSCCQELGADCCVDNLYEFKQFVLKNKTG